MSEADDKLLDVLIFPDWPAPARVRAASTTRRGGVSPPPFDSFNLGLRVGDDPANVAENRRRLARTLALPGEPVWLRQVHGNTVVRAERAPAPVEADAACTREPNSVCVVMTADCLPVLLCDRAGTCVAAVHAGWRGLAYGVIGAAVAAMACDPEDILAWLGPAIGPDAFEVGGEVRDAFVSLDAGAGVCFRASPRSRWLADIYGLARRQLRGLGVENISGGGWCTVGEPDCFFSYRRDGQRSGRMATLIWLSDVKRV